MAVFCRASGLSTRRIIAHPPGQIIKALLLRRARIVALPRMGGLGKISSSHKLHNQLGFVTVLVAEPLSFENTPGVRGLYILSFTQVWYVRHVSDTEDGTGFGGAMLPVVRCALRTRTPLSLPGLLLRQVLIFVIICSNTRRSTSTSWKGGYGARKPQLAPKQQQQHHQKQHDDQATRTITGCWRMNQRVYWNDDAKTELASTVSSSRQHALARKTTVYCNVSSVLTSWHP